jgi:pSer/pThr/pTyr-binding forkhead associated (FHA) protein/outer membrane biosynthesis protein TonB
MTPNDSSNDLKEAQNSKTRGPGDLTDTLRAGRQAVAERDRKVIVLSGGIQGEAKKTFRLDKERIVLGSVVSADVRLSGDGVEPIHAVLELLPEPVIYDLASETGVFVNGAKVVTHPLKSGDEITIGRSYLKFAVEDRAQATSQVGRERVRDSDGRKLFLNPDEDFKPLLLEENSDQIFDYRPCQKTALEVVMSWHGTILDIEHFVREKSVTIGVENRADFGIPPLLSSSNHPVVTRKGEDFVLHLDSQMKGVMQRRGKLLSLNELLNTAVKGQHGYEVPIEKDDFAKISIGEIAFFFSFTQAPPRLKRGRVFDRDPLFRKIFSASLVLTALTLYGLSTLRVVPNLEAEQIPERLATILYAPEKYAPKPQVHEQAPKTAEPETKPVPAPPKPPKPKAPEHVKIEIKPNPANEHKPVPKEMNVGKQEAKKTQPAKRPAPSKGQGAAKEGEGAKHKGTEGTRGTHKAAPDTQHQNKAQTPSPNGGKGAGSSNSQVADIGNVDFLKGAEGKIENILSGAGAHLGKGGETLKGLGGFDTRGNGGLALSGNGKGGGGSSDLAAGLGNKGRGFGRVGTGLGAAGNGNGIIGGQARVAIHTGGAEEAVVMGSIDADAVEAALLAHKDEFRLCYEKEINAEHPNLAGRVGTTFVIGSSGRVSQAGIESTTLKNANVERCVLAVIKRIDFPIPRGGGEVTVTYPFKYTPVGH